MASSKKVLKLSVIIVLFIFLLSTALVSVMYLTGNNNIVDENWEGNWEESIFTGIDSMGL